MIGARLWIALCTGWILASAAHASEEFIGMRNYSPFAHVYGLPVFADATVLDPRQRSVAFATTIVSHSDLGVLPAEAVALDGEAYITDLALSYGVSERLTVGITLPWIAYNGGVFDGAIEWWHDLWGFPNGVRDAQPDDELLIGYSRDGASEFLLDSSASGLGDVRMAAAYRLAGSAESDFGLVLRGGVKLPTGEAEKLRGSEAADFSLDVAVRRAFALPRGELVLLADAGALILGNGEVLSGLQRDTVGFAGAGAMWRLSERWRFNLQFYGQTSYFRSDLDELGSDSLSITVGGSYTWVKSRMRLSLGVVEDLIDDINPDIGVRIALSKEIR
ncbi:MAG: DUF3187 family protein [Gammaproteobacteria bacterium]|nr:DUF3187 family protein [Gammaproteobacteria bacterium]